MPTGGKEKAMTPHSSTLAWKISWTEEPGRLKSMGSLRVGYNWASSLSLFTFLLWRRKWQPIPVFFPGESQGRGSLVGCCLWGRTVGHNWSDLAAAAGDLGTSLWNHVTEIPSLSAHGRWKPALGEFRVGGGHSSEWKRRSAHSQEVLLWKCGSFVRLPI